MELRLEKVGKKYNQDWIFRGVNHTVSSGQALAILGSNGSGKSTLLQIISGKVSPNEGNITYHHLQKEIPTDLIFQYLSISAPYLELIEEYTVEELLSFHCTLKPLLPGINAKRFHEIINLGRISGKAIRYFSSGMRQRVKLALAILSDVPMVLLDEPCSNLDKQGMDWYQQLVSDHQEGRLFVVCSNHQQEEISFCHDQLTVNDYK